MPNKSAHVQPKKCKKDTTAHTVREQFKTHSIHKCLYMFAELVLHSYPTFILTRTLFVNGIHAAV